MSEEIVTKKSGKKKLIIGAVAVVLVAAIGIGGYMYIHASEVNEAVDKLVGNTVTVEGGVAVYKDSGKGNETSTGETINVKEDKPIEQYAEAVEGEVIAHIKIKGYGTITVKFFPEHAPLAVENFITHARDGYYDGVSFHRIIDNFMIQGGDPEGTGLGGESIWNEDFEDEYSKYLMPIRGALCMANAGTNTNGSQFFIVQTKDDSIVDVMNLRSQGVDRALIDYYKENGGAGWLYGKHTVFGQVIEGYDVLDAVAKVKVDGNSKPESDVIIETIELDIY